MKRLHGAALLPLLLALPAIAQQQDAQGNSCVYISGSSVCPSFPTYLGTTTLSDDYAFFSDVTDVNSFDTAATNYFNSATSGGWLKDKFQDELGCSKGANTTLQWQRTVMCAIWAGNTGSQACVTYLQGSATSNSQKICGATCKQFSDSETALTKDTSYCPARDSTGNRASTISTDLAACYDVSSSSQTNCVSGATNEPGTCGFGSDLTAACAFCATATSTDTCCTSLTCDAASSSASSDSASATPTSGSGSKSGSSKKGISGGAIAGIVIGVLALLAIIGAILFFLRRRRRNTNESHLLQTPTEKLNRHTTPMSVPEEDIFASSAKPSPAFTPPVPIPAPAPVPARAPAPTPHSYNAPAAAAIGAGAAAGAAGMAGVGAARAFNASHGHPAAPAAALAAPPAPPQVDPGKVTAGSTATAIHPYTAALDDELTLEPGMKIHVREVFDDGWATGTVSSGGPPMQLGKLGKFPMVCVGA